MTTITLYREPRWWQLWARWKRWRSARALIGARISLNGEERVITEFDGNTLTVAGLSHEVRGLQLVHTCGRDGSPPKDDPQDCPACLAEELKP